MFVSCHYTNVISITPFCLVIYRCLLTLFNCIYFLSIEGTWRKSYDDLKLTYASKQRELSGKMIEESNALFTNRMMLYFDKMLEEENTDNSFYSKKYILCIIYFIAIY